jgi:hypothetical protein
MEILGLGNELCNPAVAAVITAGNSEEAAADKNRQTV